MTVFLIDDDETVQFLLTVQLNDRGHGVEAFDNVAAFEEVLIDSPNFLINQVLLVDINLPFEDGDVFVKRVEDDLLKIEGLRIVFLTENSESIRQFQKLGNKISYVSKTDIMNWVKKNE